MNPLESRKQLLIAESELNRAQLVQEWQTMADEVHSLANQARTISSLASAAASLVAGLASFRRKKDPRRRRKTFVVADHFQRCGTGFHNLVGVPLRRVAGEGKIKGCES